LGSPTSFAFITRTIDSAKIIIPFNKCPTRIAISFTIASISLDIVYVGGEYSSGFTFNII
jgi:hypothetical protein